MRTMCSRISYDFTFTFNLRWVGWFIDGIVNYALPCPIPLAVLYCCDECLICTFNCPKESMIILHVLFFLRWTFETSVQLNIRDVWKIKNCGSICFDVTQVRTQTDTWCGSLAFYASRTASMYLIWFFIASLASDGRAHDIPKCLELSALPAVCHHMIFVFVMPLHVPMHYVYFTNQIRRVERRCQFTKVSIQHRN